MLVLLEAAPGTEADLPADRCQGTAADADTDAASDANAADANAADARAADVDSYHITYADTNTNTYKTYIS